MNICKEVAVPVYCTKEVEKAAEEGAGGKAIEFLLDPAYQKEKPSRGTLYIDSGFKNRL